MEKYILELIKENNRVIIPNFGAFIISKENGINILFNNFLSFNDGLLVNYVAEKKSIDTIVATDQVFDFVDSLKKELDEKGVYSIDKLGVFKKDENGILRFQQASDFSDIVESETESQTSEDSNDISNEEVHDNDKDTFLLDIDNTTEIIDAPEDEKIKEDDNINVEKEDEPVFTIDKENTEESREEVIEEESQKTSIPIVNEAKEPAETRVTPTSTTTKKDTHKSTQVIKEKKRRDITTFVVIALLLILCIAVYFVFFNKKKEIVKPIPVKVEKPIKKEPKVIDSVKVAEKTIEKEPETSKQKIEPQKIQSNDFYIIVGSFKQQENALKMVDKLKASGLSNAQIITKGNMYLVSADSNPSYRVIEARQQEILENNRMESWLYKIQ